MKTITTSTTFIFTEQLEKLKTDTEIYLDLCDKLIDEQLAYSIYSCATNNTIYEYDNVANELKATNKRLTVNDTLKDVFECYTGYWVAEYKEKNFPTFKDIIQNDLLEIYNMLVMNVIDSYVRKYSNITDDEKFVDFCYDIYNDELFEFCEEKYENKIQDLCINLSIKENLDILHINRTLLDIMNYNKKNYHIKYNNFILTLRKKAYTIKLDDYYKSSRLSKTSWLYETQFKKIIEQHGIEGLELLV